ncbi:histidine kinase [Marichromatium purpuratum 984]|uniref:Histidine kinase n=1 Tax=Marichromatium purpuratum 984 TaxID=765910 RepID=W0E3K7_MARPU|nr:tetratricopeptide repeat-containing response regulator [Marichromatium purpuratum]AHF04113.1 histidine kinase [Marichromatium purpuratum 984]
MAPPADFSKKTYLVIDDFSDMRSVMRSILHSLGVTRIDQARDGNEAIGLMERRHYDVVLCDYNLGSGKDGQQVLEEARHRALIGVDTIFIMVTAENTREMVMGAVEFAPDNYLAKPFTKELIKTRLAKLFERKADLAEVNRALVAKDYGRAIAALDTLIAGKPRNLAELLRLKADTCITANRYDDAMAIYDEVLEGRDLNWAHLGKGRVLFQQKQYAAAQEVFAHLLELDPNFIPGYDWLAHAQFAQKAFPAAEQTLQKGAKLSPRSVERQQRLGELALSNDDREVAEGAFDRAVAFAKHSVHNHPSIYAGLAKAKSANDKHAEALKVIGEIDKTFGDDPQAAFYKASTTAVVKQRQGDAQGATEAFAAAGEAMNALGELASPQLALEMVKTCSELGEPEQATGYLRTAIANNHDDHAFLAEVMHVCEESGIAEEADAAIRAIQQDVVRTNNQGVRLIKQGEFAAAIELLRQAADEMPANKTINLNAAKACIIKMERHGTSPEEVQLVRRYIERVQHVAPGDWRLNDVQTRLQRLATES